MPLLADLSFVLRNALRAYRWRRIAPIPSAPALAKPLSEARVALVTSAGLVAPGDVPFADDVLGGDFSFRVIPGDADVAALGEFHRSGSFDHAGIARDRNLAFPLDRLRELVAAGEVGAVAPRHLSFMGSITAPGRLVKRSAPAAAQLLVEDRVDIALLVPV
ncbi:MAG: hypothetical protein CVU56_00805 [Deltaproteobacteria bacterium HGW-Deltaproteobacteria-14]|jgi:D-proline reductase (dithiol) PrdB|nr:MAG: hypothetical protein CVU56_00805 [Deltaproteobacteria bacterium HGW-Deltaproteobacteria-14]